MIQGKKTQFQDQLPYIAGCFLGFVLLTLVFHNIDFQQFAFTLIHGHWFYLPPLITTIFVFYWIKAKRWQYLLDPVATVQTKALIPLTIIGAAVNFVLFGYVGEFVKCYLLGEQVKRSKSMIFATIILERIFDIFTILFYFGLAITFTHIDGLNLTHYGPYVIAFVLILVVSIIISVRHEDFTLNFFSYMTQLFPIHLREKILKEIKLGIEGLAAIRNPKLFVGITLTSLLQWLMMISTCYFSLMIIGINVPFHAAIIVMSIIIVGTLLPNSPGHIGMIEFCFVYGLKPFGTPAYQALSAAMIYHITLYGLVILIGSVMLKRWHLNFKGAREKGQEYNEEILEENEGLKNSKDLTD